MAEASAVPLSGRTTSWPLPFLFSGAVAIPTLLAFNLAPSPTLLNQIAALALWGWVLAWPFQDAARRPTPLANAGALLLPLIAMGGAVGWSWQNGALPAGLALSALAFIGAAIAVIAHGAGVALKGPAPTAFFAAWVVAGVLSSAIALLQVFLPEWTDGELIARSGLPGRAVGNLRQPNHLSTLLLWSSIAIVPLVEQRRLPRRIALPLFALFIFGVELSASRTGMIGVALLALWGVLDRRLSHPARGMLLSAPLVYGLGWIGMSYWAAMSHHTFGAAARLAEKDLSASRFGIWSNTWALIQMAPWTGVGFGEFNFAWSLTPFPKRPPAFFDHTHNLALQLLVELGWPLGVLVIALLLVALALAFRRATEVNGLEGTALRSAFVAVLLMAIHSTFEYPLWYAYFLLPTAWAWGYCLGAQPSEREPLSNGRRSLPSAALKVVGVVMVAGSLWAVVDYIRVSQIFEPGDNPKPLAERIASGQHSLFFAHHADYAAATVAEHPAEAWDAFKRAPHYLLDTRLMTAWAKAYAERGDLDRARHIAQRLREFHNPQSDEFFEPCDHPVAGQPEPFQCRPPAKAMDWRDFLKQP